MRTPKLYYNVINLLLIGFKYFSFIEILMNGIKAITQIKMRGGH